MAEGVTFAIAWVAAAVAIEVGLHLAAHEAVAADEPCTDASRNKKGFVFSTIIGQGGTHATKEKLSACFASLVFTRCRAAHVQSESRKLLDIVC